LETEPYKYQIWTGTLVLGLKIIWGSVWGLDLKADCSGCGLTIQETQLQGSNNPIKNTKAHNTKH